MRIFSRVLDIGAQLSGRYLRGNNGVFIGFLLSYFIRDRGGVDTSHHVVVAPRLAVQTIKEIRKSFLGVN